MGTLALQEPVFAGLGVDLSGYHRGTINVDTSPLLVTPVAPRLRIEHVEWLAGYPAESFSFSDAEIAFDEDRYQALLYYPHPETKPEHRQPRRVIELLAPLIAGLGEGDRLDVGLASSQVAVS